MRRSATRAVVLGSAVLAAAGGVGRVCAQAIPYGFAQLDLMTRVGPIPVRADGRLHLRYELHATNFQFDRSPVELIRLEVLGGDAGDRVLRRFEGADLAGRTIQPGAPAGLKETRVLPPGMRAVVFVDLDFDASRPEDVPPALRHRLTVRTGPADGKPGPRDREGVVAGAPVSVRREEPVAIAPPLRGDRWYAGNATIEDGHRRTMMVAAGHATFAQRYAIDWLRLGPDGALFHDDPKVNANHYCYGAEALAVAEGTVVDLKDGVPENVATATERAVPMTFETLGGNFVLLDLGGGRFAYYAHLQPGSLRVKRGDRVPAGAAVGLVGNSGNSDAPHLHVHVCDANSPVASEGIPYVFRTFEVQGRVTPSALEGLFRGDRWTPTSAAGSDVRRMEFPMDNRVVNFR